LPLDLAAGFVTPGAEGSIQTERATARSTGPPKNIAEFDRDHHGTTRMVVELRITLVATPYPATACRIILIIVKIDW
jgi:hypothetical protein